MVRMKKFLFGFIALVILALIVGAVWNTNCNKEHAFEVYQAKVASENMKIKELRDSLNEMRILYLKGMISIDSLELKISIIEKALE